MDYVLSFLHELRLSMTIQMYFFEECFMHPPTHPTTTYTLDLFMFPGNFVLHSDFHLCSVLQFTTECLCIINDDVLFSCGLTLVSKALNDIPIMSVSLMDNKSVSFID